MKYTVMKISKSQTGYLKKTKIDKPLAKLIINHILNKVPF